MSTPAAPSYDLKNGQLFNVLLATFVSTIGFWAWTIVGPLAKMYAKQMHLDAGMTSLLVAMPIFIGAIGRIPVGGLTDRYGGRIMFTIVLAVSAPLVLLVGVAGQMNSLPMLLITYLSNIYNFNANDAGMRAAGFAVAAVIARPFGGVLADKFGPKIITLISLGGVVILAVITAFQPDAEHVYGAAVSYTHLTLPTKA